MGPLSQVDPPLQSPRAAPLSDLSKAEELWHHILDIHCSPSDAAFLKNAVSSFRLPFRSVPRERIVKRSPPVPSEHAAEQRRLLQELLDGGAVSSFPRHLARAILPFFTVAKTGSSKRRAILDCTAVNDILKKPPSFSLPSPWSVPGLASGRKAQGLVIDVSHGYFAVPLHSSAIPWLCFEYEGQCYAFRRLPMGLSWSARVFSLLTQAAASWMLSSLPWLSSAVAYSDDFFFSFHLDNLPANGLQQILSLFSDLGFTVNMDKLCPISSSPKWLGWILDLNRSVAFPPASRVREVRRDLRSLSRAASAGAPLPSRKVAAVLGKASFLHPVWPSILVDLMPIASSLAAHTHIHSWSTSFTIHSRWASLFSSLATDTFDLAPSSLTPVSPVLKLSTDASTIGLAGTLLDASLGTRRNFQKLLATPSSSNRIALLELQALHESLIEFQVSNVDILWETDSQVAAGWIRRGRTGSWLARHLLRAVLEWLTRYSVRLKVAWIPTSSNTIADNLSRLQASPPGCRIHPEVMLDILNNVDLDPRNVMELFSSDLEATLMHYGARSSLWPLLHPDALSLDWSSLPQTLWIFPPGPLFPHALSRLLVNPPPRPFLLVLTSRSMLQASPLRPFRLRTWTLSPLDILPTTGGTLTKPQSIPSEVWLCSLPSPDSL